MKKKTIAITAISAVLIVAMIFVVIGLTQQSIGGTVINLQQTTFSSNDPEIGGQAWLLTMVQNGGGQSVYGTFSADQISSDGKTAQYPLSITLSSTPQKCLYNLYAGGSSIDTYEVILKAEKLKILYSSNGCANDCYSSGYETAQFYGLSNSAMARCYCLRKTPTATIGTVSLDKLQFSTDVIAKINGIEYRGTLSNANHESVWLGTGNEVQASWVGNLVSGEQCPSPADNDVRAVYKSNTGWILTSVPAFISYQQAETKLTTCLANYDGGITRTPQQCVDDYNYLANSAMASKSFGSYNAVQTASTTTTGKYEISLGQPIQYPTISMRVKAYLLGVVVPVGMPSIVSSDSECFKTGEDGFIVANIKNTGSTTGSFVVSAQCEQPFQQSGTGVSVQIAPSQVETVNIPITGESNTDKTANCIVSVYDRENPNNKDTKTQTACVKPIVICTAGQTRCNGVTKEACNNAGSGWNVVQGDTSCQNPLDCTKTPEDPRCGACKFNAMKPLGIIKCLQSDYRNFFSIVVGVLVALVSILILINKFPEGKGIAVAIGIVAGIFTAITIYVLFWWGIALGIVALIIFGILKVKGK